MANQELDNTSVPELGPINQLYFPENIGGPRVPNALPYIGVGDGGGSRAKLSELQQAIMNSMGAENTTEFAYENATLNDKYPRIFKGLNNEELYAQNQGALEKAGNGLAKLAGTTATTLANSTAGLLYGITQGISDGKFSSVYDNEFSQKMDDFSKYMEDKFPHYYTAAELKDPLALRSIFTGNFFWDKIVKNLGFAAGTAIGAYGFSAALEALSLSKSLVASGRALQALEATANTRNGVAELLGKQTTAGKVAAVASATIETFLSAQRAYSATIGIPIVGPALAPINAALFFSSLADAPNAVAVDATEPIILLSAFTLL